MNHLVTTSRFIENQLLRHNRYNQFSAASEPCEEIRFPNHFEKYESNISSILRKSLYHFIMVTISEDYETSFVCDRNTRGGLVRLHLVYCIAAAITNIVGYACDRGH